MWSWKVSLSLAITCYFSSLDYQEPQLPSLEEALEAAGMAGEPWREVAREELVVRGEYEGVPGHTLWLEWSGEVWVAGPATQVLNLGLKVPAKVVELQGEWQLDPELLALEELALWQLDPEHQEKLALLGPGLPYQLFSSLLWEEKRDGVDLLAWSPWARYLGPPGNYRWPQQGLPHPWARRRPTWTPLYRRRRSQLDPNAPSLQGFEAGAGRKIILTTFFLFIQFLFTRVVVRSGKTAKR